MRWGFEVVEMKEGDPATIQKIYDNLKRETEDDDKR
jgi:hypothetical protein